MQDQHLFYIDINFWIWNEYEYCGKNHAEDISSLKNCPAVYWLLFLCPCWVLYDGHDDVILDVVQEDVAHQDGAGVDEHTGVRPGSEYKTLSYSQLRFERHPSVHK